MTSYLRYQKEIRTVQDADDIESWITVRGNHIPIKKGQSKEDAVKSFLKSKGGNSSTKGSEQKNELSIAYHKDKGHIKEGNPPKGWIKVEGATTAPNGYSWYSNNKSMFGGERESYLYKDKPESSKKWSGAWSKRTNKPESLGNSAKNATSISKMTKMSASKRDEEVGFPMLEIAYNDVEFTKDPAENRSALLKAIKESKHENADLMKTVLASLTEEQLKNADTVRKGIRDYMKSFKNKKATDSWNRLWGKK